MSSLVACHSEKLRLLGICTSKPKFPDYATLASRINSFKYWPNTTNNVDEFAEAGLFITGKIRPIVKLFLSVFLYTYLVCRPTEFEEA